MAVKTPDEALDEALTFPSDSKERRDRVLRLYFRHIDSMDKMVKAGGERYAEWEREMTRIIVEGICG